MVENRRDARCYISWYDKFLHIHTIKIHTYSNWFSSFVGVTKPRKKHTNQRVGVSLIDNALHVCQEYLNSLEHCDIDVTLQTVPNLSEEQWKVFLQNYYLVIQ